MASDLQKQALLDLAKKYDELADQIEAKPDTFFKRTPAYRAGELRLVAANLRLNAEHLEEDAAKITPAKREVIARQIEMQNISYDELVDADGKVAAHERGTRRSRRISLTLLTVSLGILIGQLIMIYLKANGQ